MVGGGVEAASSADQFAGLFHAGEHFAPGFAVVAGGGENVGNTVGGVAVVQEREDGLPMWGSQWGSRQAGQVGVISFVEPVESRETFIGKEEVIGGGGWLRAEEMPGGNDEMVTFVSRVEREQEATAGGFAQWRSRARRA